MTLSSTASMSSMSHRQSGKLSLTDESSSFSPSGPPGPDPSASWSTKEGEISSSKTKGFFLLTPSSITLRTIALLPSADIRPPLVISVPPLLSPIAPSYGAVADLAGNPTPHITQRRRQGTPFRAIYATSFLLDLSFQTNRPHAAASTAAGTKNMPGSPISHTPPLPNRLPVRAESDWALKNTEPASPALPGLRRCA